MFFDNKRLLIFLITVSAILTVTFALSSCKNYFETNEYEHKILAEKKYAEKHKLSYSNTELMKSIQSEINETERKTEALYSIDSQTRASTQIVVENLCNSLSYNGEKTKGSKVYELLSEYFTEDCYKNKVKNEFVFSDQRAYKIKRDLSEIIYNKPSDNIVKCLAVVDYTDMNTSGREYISLTFEYKSDIDAYYISDLSVVKG